MPITRGLIIDTPWIDHILEGRKDWEMRSQPTSVRGWIALIRKGSGHIVAIAKLTDSGKALSAEEMIKSYEHHQIPERMIRSGEVAKWVVPWKLSEIQPLSKPIPYEHKSGAVIWVSLSETVTRQLDVSLAQNDNSSLQQGVVPQPTQRVEMTSVHTSLASGTSPLSFEPAPRPTFKILPDHDRQILGKSRLTAGNLNNNHFYLTDFLDAFPPDTIGGANAAQAADRSLTIDWGSSTPEVSDIDISKRMFRKRGWVGKFFAASGAKEGDVVVVSQISPYHLHVALER